MRSSRAIYNMSCGYTITLVSEVQFTNQVINRIKELMKQEKEDVTSDLLMLTLNRSGNFIGTHSTASQCGINGAVNYYYNVTVTCLERDVDPETGFLFDNKIVEDYFVNKYVKLREECPSCERMSAEALRFLHSMLKQTVSRRRA